MSEVLNLTGFIKDVKYTACLTESLDRVCLEQFDVNESRAYGIIEAQNTEVAVAYSTWVSPKRTRSYPFARIYNTYNASKILTIIPIIKDEGKDGDLDKLQYSTVSWMNLLNIYIVLGYYESAEKSQKPKQENKHKLTEQKFNNEFIKCQIKEILNYKQSALHWNKSLLEERFNSIFQKALDSYKNISENTGVSIHSQARMEKYLEAVNNDFEEFKNISLKGSKMASERESVTVHKHEYLVDGRKANFCIENYLGGTYYLAPDEILYIKDQYYIQESKNSTRKGLPDLTDIQDGLFKLILYSNIDSINLNNQPINFVSKLKLTGKGIKDKITLPCQLENLEKFLVLNSDNLKEREQEIIRKLLVEVQTNKKLEIEIGAN
jgi:hypothetical protein